MTDIAASRERDEEREAASTLTVAGELVGCALVDPVSLGGPDRSLVLRCGTISPTGPSTVVVKRYPDTVGGAASYARETAGLAEISGAPALLGADDAHRIVVMEDLGHGPTLADLLLGDDRAAAWDGALGWATALGDAVGRSHPRAAHFRKVLGRQGITDWDALLAARTGIDRLRSTLPPPGAPAITGGRTGTRATADSALAEDVAAMRILTSRDGDRGPGSPPADVVSPGDTCPDNAILTPTGWRFLDLEGATAQHVALDAAYMVMPFATCWCVFDPPPGLTDALLERFTAAVAPHLPDVVVEPGWSRALDLAAAAWILAVTGWLIDGALADDPNVGPPELPSPSYRQLLASRWGWGASRLGRTVPAVAELLANASRWAEEERGAGELRMGPYRAFGS